ncbi:MAG TPA: D-aminoacylase [Thermodesulfobacteriota bacterium]
MTTTLVRGATVVDGTGSPPRRADILVRGDRIADVGLWERVEAGSVVDADGLVATPGFIDTHFHGDLSLFADPIHACTLRQGVTTVILGQDGLSYAPLGPANLDLWRRYLVGLNGKPDVEARWSSVAEYRRALDRRVAVNTAYAVPHAALRLETVGFRNVPLEGAMLDRARALLERGFEEGAVAFSTGLSYFPNAYADTRELVALCRVAAHAGRPYVTHVRTVFDVPPADWLLAGLEEALEIGRQSGVAVHVSHFGPKPWRYESPDALTAPVDRAKADGVDVTLELYPYPAGNTFALIYLPPFAHEGGPDALLARIRSGERRKEMLAGIEANTIRPHGATLAYLPSGRNRRYLGRTIDEVARDRGLSVAEAVLALLDEEDLAVGCRDAVPPMDDGWRRFDAELMHLLARGDYTIGSDAIPAAEFPHPRTYGAFPRVLRVGRETGGLPLERLVHLMTGLPAARFGLTGRGRIAPGAFADLVLLEADRVADRSTYDEPTAAPVGVRHVMVNGEWVLRDGEPTGRRPGRSVP